MFNYIKGIVKDKSEGVVVVENNGIGFEFFVSNNTIFNINEGDEVVLYSYFQVREDGVALFGFYSKEEKDMFLNLITVNGVGPKMAIGILSGSSLSDLGNAILREDVAFISKIKGCGKKTAERIVLDLRDKIDAFGIVKVENKETLDVSVVNEAVEVLVSLGTPKNQALTLVSSVAKQDDSVETLVERALKNMG